MCESNNKQDKENFPLYQKLLLIILNYIPLFHTLLIVAIFAIPYKKIVLLHRVGIAFAVLYLLPPLCARIVLLLSPIRNRRIAWGGREAFTWWLIHSLQVLFTRFSFLEELLRIVPGLYSMWLRLWGAEIGALTYWAPGMTILDRSFLKIGKLVVFGAGVRLNPHVFTKEPDGQGTLMLAPVEIGDNAMVGGYSLLTAGSRVAAGETVIGTTVLPPFAVYENGRRHLMRNSQNDHLNKESELSEANEN